MPPILEADHVTKSYAIAERQIAVLDDVSFAIAPGEFVVIMGSSGSGKSTLLSILSGLDQPTRGRVRIDGTDITDWSEDQLAPVRNKVFGFVFQSFHLVPSLNAIENIAFPAELAGDPQARKRAQALLDRVGLGGAQQTSPTNSPGERSSALLSAAPSSINQRSSLPTSPRATWTRPTAPAFLSCWWSCTRNAGPRLYWSRTARKLPNAQAASLPWLTARW